MQVLAVTDLPIERIELLKNEILLIMTSVQLVRQCLTF